MIAQNPALICRMRRSATKPPRHSMRSPAPSGVAPCVGGCGLAAASNGGVVVETGEQSLSGSAALGTRRGEQCSEVMLPIATFSGPGSARLRGVGGRALRVGTRWSPSAFDLVAGWGQGGELVSVRPHHERGDRCVEGGMRRRQDSAMGAALRWLCPRRVEPWDSTACPGGHDVCRLADRRDPM